MADTFADLDLFAGIGQNAHRTEPPARATFLRRHTHYHSEIRLSDDPVGIIRVISNERLREFGLCLPPDNA